MRRLLAVALATVGMSAPASALAATIDVTTTADEYGPIGACSLREAVRSASEDIAFGGCADGDAGGLDTIRLAAGQPYQLTRAGAGEDANATGDLDLDTSGGAATIGSAGVGVSPTIDAALLDRALDVTGSGSVRLDGIRVVRGDASGLEAGGAVRWSQAGDPGDLTVTDSHFENNSAGTAAAIEAETTGTHVVEDSSFSGNAAFDRGAIHSFGTLEVVRSSVTGNGGGGIAAEGDELTLSASTVAGNTIGADTSNGGVFAAGDAVIVNSTVSGNTGGFVGGIEADGELTVRFSTIAGNLTGSAGGNSSGGIDVLGATGVSLEGTIVAGNQPIDCNAGVSEGGAANLESATGCGLNPLGGSLVNADPQLAPLAANGGPTGTRGLYPGSPAIDAAGGCGALGEDQRGEPRPLAADCDIGAFEGLVPRPPAAAPPAAQPQAKPKTKKKKKKCKPKRRKCKKRALAAAPTTVIGRSVEGRPIRAVRIGDPDAERVALVVGVIHGDERAGLAITRWLRRLGPRIDDAQVWLIDSLNPDGARARTRRNAHGVDLNRNFPHGWRGGVPQSSGYYPGPSAASEPETRAAMSFIERIEPDVSIWYHQPWGAVLACKGRPRAGARYAKLSGLAMSCRGRGLPGTAISWEQASLAGSPAFVVELGREPLGERAARRHAKAAVRVAEGG